MAREWAIKDKKRLQFIEYPTLDRVKITQFLERNVIKEQTKEKWNNQGIFIDGI